MAKEKIVSFLCRFVMGSWLGRRDTHSREALQVFNYHIVISCSVGKNWA